MIDHTLEYVQMLSKLRALEESRPNLARLERVGSSVKGKHAQENMAKRGFKARNFYIVCNGFLAAVSLLKHTCN